MQLKIITNIEYTLNYNIAIFKYFAYFFLLIVKNIKIINTN